MKKTIKIIGIIGIFAISFSNICKSKDERFSGKPLPRFSTTAFDKVKSYVGPNIKKTIKYPQKYTYNYKNTPLKIINEFYPWRQVQDVDGKISWVFSSDLSSQKTGIITKDTILFDDNDIESDKIAKVKVGVIFKIKKCKKNFCYGEIKYKDTKLKGYILENNLWGHK